MNKRIILAILLTALVAISGTIGAIVLLNANSGSIFANSFTNGYYVEDTDDEDKITLDIDGNKALVTNSYGSYVWTIDRSKECFLAKKDGDTMKIPYEMIADKLVINYDGTKISFVKSAKKIVRTSDNSSSESKSKLTVDIVTKKAEKGVGLAPSLVSDLMYDLEYSTEYEDATISVDFVDVDGNTIDETEEGYTVDQVFNVNEEDDNWFEVTFIVSKK